MNGLLVRIKGSRRHWRVMRDDGKMLRVVPAHRPRSIPPYAPSHKPRDIPRSDVTARRESGVWVPTEIEAA